MWEDNIKKHLKKGMSVWIAFMWIGLSDGIM
jgi:hypothetical protein